MQENNDENVLDELDEVLGEEPKDEDVDELVKHLSKIKEKIEVNEKFIGGVKELQLEQMKMTNLIGDLIEVLEGKSVSLPDVFDVNVKNTVDEVTVKNLSDIKIPEPSKELKVTNLDDIPNYKEDIKAMGKLTATLIQILNNKEIKGDLDRYLDPKRPLSVRLSDGKRFYDAIGSAVSSAMEVFVNSAGTPKSALVDASGHLQVDVQSMPAVTVDTTGLATSTKQDTQITALEKIDDIQDVIKTRGATAGATDKGIPAMARYEDTDAHKTLDDGDYAILSVNDFGELRTRDQRAIDLANCNVSTDYTVLGNDTDNLANSTNHVFGVGAIKFDKVNGAANTVYAGVSKTITALNLAEIFEAGGFVGLSVYLPSLTNVVNVFLRIGTDSTNYNAWTWAVADLTGATWLNLRKSAAQPDGARNTGNGWNPAAVTYIAFGVEFSGETNTLANILFDHVHIVGGRVTATDITTSISGTVVTPNVNVQKVGGTATDTNNGTVSAGTQRVTIASDSTGQIIANGGVASNSADSGNPVKVGGKYNSTAPTFDDGDRGEIQISSRGNLLAELKSGTTSMQNGNGILTQGGIAHDSADAGNPIKDGGKAHASMPTAVADADRVNAYYDLYGVQHVASEPLDKDITAHTNYARKYYTSTGAATDGIVWSPAAGKRWHVTSLIFQTSADATITFEDDKAGGDDPVLKGEFKAGSGLALTFDEKYPFASGEDAADLTVTTSAGNIYVTVVGYEI